MQFLSDNAAAVHPAVWRAPQATNAPYRGEQADPAHVTALARAPAAV